MSGNKEREQMLIDCPECGVTWYFTLTIRECSGVAYVYPIEPEKTRFSNKTRLLDNPWERVEQADGVFCPSCRKNLDSKYVRGLVQHLYRLKAEGYDLESGWKRV